MHQLFFSIKKNERTLLFSKDLRKNFTRIYIEPVVLCALGFRKKFKMLILAFEFSDLTCVKYFFEILVKENLGKLSLDNRLRIGNIKCFSRECF